VLFTFPSRYWFTIGRREYLALEGGPPDFPRDFPCPVVLRCPADGVGRVSSTGLSPTPADRPRSFDYAPSFYTAAAAAEAAAGSSNPSLRNARRLGTHKVWAVPRSLTTTGGISVDVFSSGY
jgi:hypothetical protein